MKLIHGFRVEFEKIDESSPNFWSGSVQIESIYKRDFIYFSCIAETHESAIAQAKARFGGHKILNIDLRRRKENE